MGETGDINLNNYERLSIIREELEARSKDLKTLERKVDEIRTAIQRRKFLWALCPDYYKSQPPPEGAKDLATIEQEKARMENVVNKLSAARAALEKAIAQGNTGAAPSSPAPPPAGRQNPPPQRHRRASFD